MDVFYDSKKLMSQCEDPVLRKKAFGKIADSIWERLSELSAADRLSEIPEVPPPRRHKMKGKSSIWSLNLSKNYRMWIYGFGEEDPANVTKVQVVRIFDDH